MPADPARFVLTLSCGDRRGIVAAVANCITSQDCNIVESAQYGDPQTMRFFMRVSFAAPPTRDGGNLPPRLPPGGDRVRFRLASSTTFRSNRG